MVCDETPGYELQGTDLLTVDTLEHGELGPELSDIGLGGDLQNMGLASVHDQLHGDTISTSGICTTFILDNQICTAREAARMPILGQQKSATVKNTYLSQSLSAKQQKINFSFTHTNISSTWKWNYSPCLQQL